MNNIAEYVQNSCVHLYDRKLKLICIGCFDLLRCDINGLYEESRRNLVEFRPEKYKRMNFNCSTSSLVLGEDKVHLARAITVLGVTADLRWSPQFKTKIFNF